VALSNIAFSLACFCSIAFWFANLEASTLAACSSARASFLASSSLIPASAFISFNFGYSSPEIKSSAF